MNERTYDLATGSTKNARLGRHVAIPEIRSSAREHECPWDAIDKRRPSQRDHDEEASTDRPTDRQTGRQIDQPTDRPTGRPS